MTKTITQNVTFKNAKVATLYSMFLNSKHHAAITGDMPAKISDKEGSAFTAHDNYIKGRNLQLVKDKLIVQSWASVDWTKNDVDSTFILLFEQKEKDVVIHMTHANIPDKEVEGIKSGWNDYYWKPWKKYLTTIQ